MITILSFLNRCVFLWSRKRRIRINQTLRRANDFLIDFSLSLFVFIRYTITRIPNTSVDNNQKLGICWAYVLVLIIERGYDFKSELNYFQG